MGGIEWMMSLVQPGPPQSKVTSTQQPSPSFGFLVQCAANKNAERSRHEPTGVMVGSRRVWRGCVLANQTLSFSAVFGLASLSGRLSGFFFHLANSR